MSYTEVFGTYQEPATLVVQREAAGEYIDIRFSPQQIEYFVKKNQFFWGGDGNIIGTFFNVFDQ